MPRTRLMLFLICLSATLLACQFVTSRFSPPDPEATPAAQASEESAARPTATEAQPTATLEPPTPTITAPAIATMAFPPTEAPSPGEIPTPGEMPTEWKAIPIMPGATQGKDSGSVYSYKIESKNAAIKEFYETELARLGWAPFATGAGDGTDNLFMMFQKGDQMVTIATVDQYGQVMVVISVM